MKAKLMAVFMLAVMLLGGLPDRGAHAEGHVDLALALVADVSGSVDDHKFRLQRDGYAAALISDDVLRAIASGPNGTIALAFIEFASADNQQVVIDWTVLRDAESATIVAELIRTEPRSFQGGTAIGAAVDFAAAQLAASGIEADRRVIDVSGDGTNNDGFPVTQARDAAVAAGITINGIAILSPEALDSHTNPPGGLLAYYKENVIGGPGAFALAAENFSTFAKAIQNKLIREIAGDSHAEGHAQAWLAGDAFDLLP
jgi:hypothetical protein